jgi:hypothetical protein
MNQKTYNILSLGAGVQSSALALMADRGEFENKLDAAVFADTQAEPASVMNWLEWLKSEIKTFPVFVVTCGKLDDAVLSRKSAKGKLYSKSDVPFFVRNEDETVGQIKNRSCTADFKIRPVRKKIKEIAGIRHGQKHVTVKQWIGISLDETQRMKPSRDAWCENVFPLVESRMRRGDCFEWMRKNGFPQPPRSSCVYCPFHNDDEWRRLKQDEPDEFDRAIRFEKALQNAKRKSDFNQPVPFLHRSAIPLSAVDFSTDVDRGQLTMWDDNWTGECEGMCGL